MLILDVITRWSSTHQMLSKLGLFYLIAFTYYKSGRALLYRTEIGRFIANRRELRHLELNDGEWEAIKTITDWLGAYRRATEHMSQTKQVTLSAVHAIFHGLQEHLKKCLRNLPASAPQRLVSGLINAQQKLAEYHTYIDKSPYYLWACCKYLLNPTKMC